MPRNRQSRRYRSVAVAIATLCLLGSLMARAVFAAGNPLPVATLSSATALIGEPVTLTVTFDNASLGAGDQTGYGPYIDLFLDTTGPDGVIAPPYDGLETSGIRATYLGQPLPGLQLITITGASYTHPLTGQTLAVPGYGTRFQNGDTIAVLTLPFGSFTNTQPPAPIAVNLQLSNLADLGTPLPVSALAGFRYGNDPLDNPGADPPLRQGTAADADVTPQLWTLSKTYLGPEDETATGRNYPRRYRLDVDIAEGQPVTGLQITDQLASSMQITGATAAQMSARIYNTAGVPTEVFTPASLSGTATPATPGGTLVYSFGPKTGVRGIDASFEFEFYIPRDTSAATATIPQGTDSTFANNTGSSSAAWTPIDPRDTATPITITLPPNAHTLQQHSLATQKSVTPVDRTTLAPTGGAIVPGATLLRYDIDFQVSDYFAVQDVYLEDIFSDGQRLFVRSSGASTVPTLQVNNAYVSGATPGRTTIAAAPFGGTGTIEYQQRFTTRGTPLSDPTSPPSAPLFTIQPPAPAAAGETYVRFNISQELIARGVSGRLVGGDIPNAGGAPQNNNPPLFSATTGRITFYTEVKDEFSDDFPSGDRSVDQLDILRNRVPQIRGNQINTATINAPTPTVIGPATDDTAASVSLPIGNRSKMLYALNGQTTNLGAPVTTQPGDLVTYRLTYSLPLSSFENVRMIDFPPLPVFPVPANLFFDSSAAPGTIPGEGIITIGPGDTYQTIINPPRSVRVASTANISGYVAVGIGSFSSAPAIIDGVTLANGDRVLLKDQTNPTQNGVYTVDNAATGVWTRASDFDTSLEVVNGPLFGVAEGVVNARRHFRESSRDFTTFNTDPITFEPFIVTDPNGNSFTLNFGWHDDIAGGRRSSVIDVLVTLRVADAPFTDDLFLTNQLRVSEASTNAGAQDYDEIVRFEVIRPDVSINKGIVGYGATGLTLGGVGFNSPGGPTTISGTPIFTPTQALAIGASDSVQLSDAGDAVRYAIVVQNQGRGDAYDVTITDQIPTGYILPASLAGANFTVRRGDGTLLSGDVISDTVRAATTAPLAGATYAPAPSNGRFTNAPRIIDGITLYPNDRVLIKDQADARQNGIYTVTSVVTSTAIATLTRAGDFDEDTELAGGYRVAVLGGLGAANANRVFSTPGPVTLNTTSIVWAAGSVSDYYTTYNPVTGAFSVTLADTYTAGNTSAVTRDDRPGGLSRGRSGAANPQIFVTNGSNTIIVTYDVTLGSLVEPNESIVNTATLTNVATSDGGMDDPTDPSDSAEVIVRLPALAKTLIATEIENAANTRPQVVIGELATYTVTLTIPEGTTTGAQLVDTLDAGLAFVDVTNVTASPALSFSGGGLPGVGASPSNTVIGAGGQTVTFNFGTITNSDRDNDQAETIVITYRAIVLNSVANQSGAQRNNSAAYTWAGPNAIPPVSATNVTVIESTLTAAKSVPAGTYDSGDTIEYTIELRHAPGSQTDAYDTVLTDTLPLDPLTGASLILAPSVMSVVDSAGILGTADFTLTGSDAAGWTLINPTPIDFPPGRTVTLVVRGTLSSAAAPEATITNSAFLRWTSLDGDPGQRSTYATASTERTGADGPGGALNDYAATTSASFDVPTVAAGKALVTTSEAHTAGANVAIGEIARYRIAVSVPESTIYSFSLLDQLPIGLTFLNDGSARFAFISDSGITTVAASGVATVTCPSITPAVASLADVLDTALVPSNTINCASGDSNISNSETSNSDTYASGTDVYFRFANLTNLDNDANAEYVVIEFNAIADNEASADPNDAGDVRANSAITRHDPPGPVGLTNLGTASPPVNVTVVEPGIPFSGATNNKTASPTTGDAFDTITYTIVYTNATGANVSDAFDVRVLDTLPAADLTLIPASVNVTSGCATGVTNASAGNTIDVTLGRVPPGCAVTITYQATLNVSVIPAQAIINTANLTYTSLPGNGSSGDPLLRGSIAGASGSNTGERNGTTPPSTINDYFGSDGATVTIVSPVLAKRIVATSEAHTAGPLTLADFNNTGFSGFLGGTNTWSTAGNVTLFPNYVRISGSATEQGGGFITFGSPVDLSGHTDLAISARLVAGNAADNIDLHLQDADGTNWRWRFAATSFNATSFTLVPVSMLGPGSTAIAAGTTPGLDLRNITRLEIRGDNGTVQFDIDIDAVIAFGATAVPGEIVRYRLITTIPEGTSPNLQLLDRIRTGIRFINDNTVRVAFVSNSGGIVSTSAGSQVPALSGAGLTITGNQDNIVGVDLSVAGGNGLTIGAGTAFDGAVASSNNVNTDAETFNNGSDVNFRLGNITNNDNDADLEYVIVEFNAQVLNTASVGNQAGIFLNNDFQYFRSGTQAGTTSTQNAANRVTVVEPRIDNLSKQISGAPPIDAGDLITYTLRFANGASWPTSPAVPVRVATTANIAGFNATGGLGGTGQFTSAPVTVDGVTLNVGDRILVRSQTTASQNGVYTLVFIDPLTGARTWDRATDLDSSAELAPGYRVVVQEGATQAGITYYLDDPIPAINAGALNWRAVSATPTVAVATTASLGGGAFNESGGTLGRGTLTTTATTIDSVTVNATNFPVGTRILVKNQSTASQNGIYRVIGLAGGVLSLERVPELDSQAEAVIGAHVLVTGGTINAGRSFAIQTAPTNTPITTNMGWALVDQVTAFDMRITDALPPSLLFESVSVSLPAGSSIASQTTPPVGANGTIDIVIDRLDAVDDIASGPTDVTVTVVARVAPGTTAGIQLPNTARVQYTSLPGDRGTLGNPTGSDVGAGTAGTQNGERTGQDVPNPTNNTPPANNTILNNYSVGATIMTQLSQPAFVKTFQGGAISDDDSSVAGTTGANVAVGEGMLYDLLVTLPEGTTRNLRVTDTVPAGLRFDTSFNSGAGYQIVTSAGGQLTAGFSDPAAVAAPALAAAGAGTLGQDGVDALFTFGDVTVSADNNAANNAFIIRVRLIATNTTTNQSGATRDNSAALTYTDGYTGLDRPLTTPGDPRVTIVEPTPSIIKAVSGIAADAGDPITYTLRLENSAPRSEMIAYDLVISDTIAAELLTPAIAGVSATGAPGIDAADFEIASVAGSNILRTVAPIDLPLSATVIITFTGDLASSVTTDQIITNRAAMFWSSTPGANADERNGSGVPAPPECRSLPGDCNLDAGQLNNYGLASSVTTTAIAPMIVSKSVVAGLEPSTTGTNVTIGEIVTYRLAVSLPEGITSGIVITDTVPAGMAFLPGSATLDLGPLAADPPLSAGHPAGAGSLAFNGVFTDATDPAVTAIGGGNYLDGTDVRFDFGQITLPGDNNLANNTFFIRYRAVVLDVAGTTGLSGSQTTLTNNGRFDVPSTPLPPADLLIDPNGATVTVVEPELAIAKSVAPPGGDAGDPLTYTIVVNHTGRSLADAFDVTIRDVVPATIGATVNSPITIANVTVTHSALGTITGNFTVTGNTLDTTTPFTLARGATVTVTITGVLRQDIQPGAVVANTGDLAYTSLPGPNQDLSPDATGISDGTDRERIRSGSSSASLSVPQGAFGKDIFGTSAAQTSGANVTVGEVISYTLAVTLPEGTTRDLVVSDNLPPGLDYEGYTIITAAVQSGGRLAQDFSGTIPPISVSGGAGSGDDVTFTFGGNVVTDGDNAANNRFLIVLRARVLDEPGVVGITPPGATSLPNGATLTYTDGTGATITRTGNTGASVVEPRLTTTKSVTPVSGIQAGDTVTYTVTVTNTGTSAAFDVTLDDTLPAEVANPQLVACTIDGTAASAAISGAAPNITIAGNPAGSWDLAVGSVLRCTYTVTARADIPLGDSFTNTVDADWYSLDGAPPEGRSYTDSVARPTDGTQDTDSATFTTAPLNLEFDKRDDRATATIGERVTYTLTITASPGLVRNVIVSDTLPAGLTFDTGFTPQINGIATVPAFTQAGQALTWNFGDATFTSRPATIVYRAIVADVPGNTGLPPTPTTLVNDAELSFRSGVSTITLTDNDSVTLVEPRLTIVKNIVQTQADAGDQLTIVLTVENTGTAPAHDVVVSDTLTADFDAATTDLGVAGTDYPASFSATRSGSEIRYEGGPIAAGASVTFTFRVDLDETVAPGATVTNTGRMARSTTISGNDPNERTQPPADSTDTVVIRGNSLRGFVYVDADNDGVFDAGETPIQGVEIRLSGTDHLGNTVNLTTTTLANGSYAFTGLRPSNATGYTLTEIQPAGYRDGRDTIGTPGGATGNDIFSSIVLPTGVTTNGVNNNFGELLGAGISGFVYEDDDNDGVFETGETGISGVTITLNGTDDLGATVSLTTTTVADGSYSFTGLRPGTYTVSETQPGAYLDGRDTAGSLGGSTATNDQIAGITLASGDASVNNNFGELRPASLAGTVYRDDNNNAIPDTGEPGIGGVTITLNGTDDLGATVNLTTTTLADGTYSFTGLRPGTYTVSETQPAAYNDGLDRVGTAGGTLANDQVSNITLNAGTSAVQYDFGELGTFVSGVVWIDLDRDGALDGSETGRLAGITITLRDSGGTVVGATVTLADGSYRFDNLAAGDYSIEQTQPSGYGSSTPNTLNVLVPLTGLSNQNFGETLSTLSGAVYVDTNNNGVFDGGESGIGGVTITLTGTDATGAAVNHATLTLSDGSYSFTGLLAGNYTISETQPAIYSDGLDAVGTIGGVATGTGGNDVTSDITLPPGSDGIRYDFGELADAGLGDRVWLDRNGDGTQDPGEPGIAGVTVYLDLDNNGALDGGEPTTTTDTNGLYFFGGLAGGTYTVRVDTTTLPGGASPTYDLDGVGATPHAASATLAAGATRTDVDFGYRGDASLGDRVWLDRNDDGAQDPGEPGLRNVIVYLDLNGNSARDAAEPFATTGADGNYLIGGLAAGTYTVRVDTTTLPGGVTATYDLDGAATPGSVTGVTLTTGQARTDVDFGYRGDASLGDRVWDDANASGIQDAGENGISGVLVELYDGAGTLILTTTTDLNGNYRFDNLPAGTYSIGVGATPGRSISPRGAGGAAEDSDIDQGTRRSDPVALAAGEARNDLDIGLYRLASVGSLVWLDRNLDGIHTPDEPGIGGITVRLVRPDGTTVATLTTATDGTFLFSNIEPGAYRLAFTVPGGYYVSPPRRGNDSAADSDADQDTGETPLFTLIPGQTDLTWFMGLSPISPTAIQLARFSAERSATGVVISWETTAEQGTRGFYLERSTSGARSDAIRITPLLIPARGHNGAGASYTWNDATAEPGVRYSYWLVEVTASDATHIYGPATLQGTTGGPYVVTLPLVIR